MLEARLGRVTQKQALLASRQEADATAQLEASEEALRARIALLEQQLEQANAGLDAAQQAYAMLEAEHLARKTSEMATNFDACIENALHESANREQWAEHARVIEERDALRVLAAERLQQIGATTFAAAAVTPQATIVDNVVELYMAEAGDGLKKAQATAMPNQHDR